MQWEERIAKLANDYLKGDQPVQDRRSAWEVCASGVLLPTLERAAEVIRKSIRAARTDQWSNVTAKRVVFGENLEAVQLYTGQFDTRVVLSESRLVFEVGATLGYSLCIDGRVAQWHREHWFDPWSPESRHPPMIEDEIIDDPSTLTVADVERTVEAFLKGSIETSFRRSSASKRAIGFFATEDVGESQPGWFEAVDGQPTGKPQKCERHNLFHRGGCPQCAKEAAKGP